MRTIEQILHVARTVAVVGLSNKPERASLEVATYLQQQGYRIIPINPAYAGQEILGEIVYATLQEAANALAPNGTRIDVVDCFRKAEEMQPIAKDAIDVRAGCLWMQLGIENQVAADLARAAGLDVVMNQCMLIEHRKLGAQAA
ncbi:MAG: CoA-binding protein [Massilia sp.]|nr:CoA-binding protein [Massilia sp.]